MKNIVRELEAKGIIPQGKYDAAFKKDEMPEVSLLKLNGKFGLCTSKATCVIPPIFNKIEKDESGNYVCYGVTDGKVFCKIYDAELNPIEVKM